MYILYLLNITDSHFMCSRMIENVKYLGDFIERASAAAVRFIVIEQWQWDALGQGGG